MDEVKRMILQCKLGGADFIKVQLYSSSKLFGNKDRNYIEISKKNSKRSKNIVT